jgi:DNA-binding response OmpR family regulator
MRSKTVLVVEDTPDIATHIVATLEAADWQVVLESRGATGLARAKAQLFDILIFDRMLPDAEGLDLVETLRNSGIETPVLMLTALGNSENKIEGYERGADDYLAKPFEPAELVARVEALLRRANGTVRRDLQVICDLEVHRKARTAHRNGKHLKMSPKEFDLLLYFIDNEGALITRDMLLRDVWNLSFDPGTNVVDVNIGRMRRKLDENSDAPLLETVRGLGYRFGILSNG